jgi:N-acetylglucosamine-6-phosphate deacetylase
MFRDEPTMSKLTAYLASNLFDGALRRRDVAILVEGDRVQSLVEPGGLPEGVETAALGSGLVAPGFIDLQVNGGGGALLNSATSVEGVRSICEAHARYGTTALLPTLITDTPAVTEAAIAAVRDAIEAGIPGCLGIHVEGPHLSVARKGVHNPDYIRPMDEADLQRLVTTGIDHVLTTVAAETVPPEQIARLSAAGITVAIGHSDASYEVAMAAFNAGARGITHLFNAMSQLGHRSPGVVGAALDSPDAWCGIIPDGFHVHPAAIANALRAKRAPGRIFIVTDAMSTIGTRMTQFELNGRVIHRNNGKLTIDDGTLAGSDLHMVGALRYMTGTVGVGLEETLRMASLYPAQFLGIDRTHGRIAPGSRADFVQLSEALDVEAVYIGGVRQHFAPLA